MQPHNLESHDLSAGWLVQNDDTEYTAAAKYTVLDRPVTMQASFPRFLALMSTLRHFSFYDQV